MIIVSYDISNNKKRNAFAKYLKKFGHRLQYSVFQITNSQRILENIKADVENKFSKLFDETDSIYIFTLSNTCDIIKWGYASHEDDEMIVVK